MLSPSINTRVHALAQVCGRTLLFTFAVSVFFAVFPIELGSSLWGTQVSRRIIDRVFIALVGVALLCAAAYLKPMPEDPYASRRRVTKLVRQRRFAFRLCHIGVFSMVLLALWQLLLMMGSIGQINQSILSQSRRISPAIETGKQLVRQASDPQLEQSWERFIAAGAPGLKKPVSDSGAEQKREALLKAIQIEQRQLDRTITSRGHQARMLAVRDTMRRIALCTLYGAGFFSLRRCLV
jgi:hypothetical protein